MHSSLAAYAITLIELKGVRLSHKRKGKSHWRSSLFGWKKKCCDPGDADYEAFPPSMRVVVWRYQQDDVSTGVEVESILSCPMEEVSRDEDGGIVMNCEWPDGSLLYVPNDWLSNEGEITLGLGILSQNEALLPIGTVTVSFYGCCSYFLTFLPLKKTDEKIYHEKYDFDVNTSILGTVLDYIASDESSRLSVSQNGKDSNVILDPLLSEVSETTQFECEDWKKPWDAFEETEKVDDFSFGPVVVQLEQVEHVQQKEQVEQTEKMEQSVETEQVEKAECEEKTVEVSADVRSDDPSSPSVIEEEKNDNIIPPAYVEHKDKSVAGDCCNQILGSFLYGKMTHLEKRSTAEVVEYPTSLIAFKDVSGETNHVEFTDDGDYRPSTPARFKQFIRDAYQTRETASYESLKKTDEILKDLEELLLKKRPKYFLNKRNRGKSSSTVSTASTSSSSSNTSQEKNNSIYEEEFAPGCGFALAGLVDVIRSRECGERTFGLCLDELSDEDDDSFDSESHFSAQDDTSVNTHLITNMRTMKEKLVPNFRTRVKLFTR
jgi:hypothetical protein